MLHFVLPLFRDFLSFSYRAEGRDTYFASQMKFQVLERVINILCIAWSCRRDNSVPSNITILPFFFFFFNILWRQESLFQSEGVCLVLFFLLSPASNELHWWFWKTTTEISQSTTQPC